MFLSFEEYKSFGGTLEQSEFSIAVWRAEQKINCFEGIPVKDRLLEFDAIPEDIKMLITELIEREAMRRQSGRLTAVSQSLGNESVSKSFAAETFSESETADADLIKNVLGHIPYRAVTLYYRGADCD